MRKNLLAAIVLLVLYIPSVWAAAGYPVRGRVIDRLSREPVAYAAVTITGQPGKGWSPLHYYVHRPIRVDGDSEILWRKIDPKLVVL